MLQNRGEEQGPDRRTPLLVSILVSKKHFVFSHFSHGVPTGSILVVVSGFLILEDVNDALQEPCFRTSRLRKLIGVICSSD